jgi:hypothetical protein
MSDLPPDRYPAVVAVLTARMNGATLREAARAGGIHVATLCRWRARDPILAHDLHTAVRLARRMKAARRPRRRPSVKWHPDCPVCCAPVGVRLAGGVGFAFWLCSRWPDCPFASWRPRAREDCPGCGSAWFWAHSRKSIGCPGCGLRLRTNRH